MARAVLQSALECGITLFDTGASYADGHAEQRLGRLLRELGADPEKLVIATKAGTRRDRRGRLVKDFRPDQIRQQLAGSLKRLGMPSIAVLQLHGPPSGTINDELRRKLELIREDGMAQRLGVNADHNTLATHVGDPLFDVVMPFLSVREPHARALAGRAGAAGQAVLAAGPLARMTFRPPWMDWLRRSSGRWYLARALARSPRALLSAGGLRRVLEHPGWSPAQLALAWALEQPGVTAAIIGTTRPEHVVELAEAAQRPLPDAVRNGLEALFTRQKPA